MAVLCSCEQGPRQVDPEARFVLRSGETARVKGSDLFVRIASTGVTEADDGSPVYLCGVELRIGGKTEKRETIDIEEGKSAEFGIFIINVADVEIRKSCELLINRTTYQRDF
jgi:hypothetical protein